MRRGSTLRQYLQAFGAALLLLSVIRGFGIQAFRIPSTSMFPTLLLGDHLLVSKLRYGLRRPWGDGWLVTYARPRVGDVVVFVPPEERGEPDSRRSDFVKRVVAVEGEVVEICDHRVLVNGQPRDSTAAYAADMRTTDSGVRADVAPRRLEAGQFYVLGDHRSHSRDSREWGPVDMAGIEGKAVMIYWSWDPRAQRVRWERVGSAIR